MPSKYDAYWQSRIPDLKRLLDALDQPDAVPTLTIADIEQLGDRQSWRSKLELVDGQVVTAPTVFMRSLGNLLAAEFGDQLTGRTLLFTTDADFVLHAQVLASQTETAWFESGFRQAKLQEALERATDYLGPLTRSDLGWNCYRTQAGKDVYMLFSTTADGWFAPRAAILASMPDGDLVLAYTNPVDHVFSLWQIPVPDLMRAIEQAGHAPTLDGGKGYSLNVVIDNSTQRLRQLDWDIQPYLLEEKAQTVTRSTYTPMAASDIAPLSHDAMLARLNQWRVEATDPTHPNHSHADLAEAATKHATITSLVDKLRTNPDQFGREDAAELFGTLDSGQRKKNQVANHNDLGELRAALSDLLFAEGDPATQIGQASARIRYAGQSMLGELYGWVHIDATPKYNHCATDALHHLGYPFETQDHAAFVAQHEQFKAAYLAHGGRIQPELPLNLEIDKLYNVIDKVDLKQATAAVRPPHYWRITLPTDSSVVRSDGTEEAVDLWTVCLREGIAAIGFDDDVEDYQVQRFMSIQPGDKIVAFLRHKNIGGIGEVTWPYDPELFRARPSEQDYWGGLFWFRIGVAWKPHTIAVDDLPPATAAMFGGKTVVELDPEQFAHVKALMPQENGKPPGTNSNGTAYEFTGFDPDAFRFLSELKKNNNKEWMQANQARYQTHIRETFRALFKDVGPALKQAVEPYLLPDELEIEPKFGYTLATIKKRWPTAEGAYYSYYWGAFYRRQMSKQTDAQLFVNMYESVVRVGFYIGQQASKIDAQFRQRVMAQREAFFKLLSDLNLVGDFVFERTLAEGKEEVVRVRSAGDLEAWLETSQYNLLRSFAATDPVVQTPAFADKVFETLLRVFPVYLWAVADNYIEACDAFLSDVFPPEEDNDPEPEPYGEADFLAMTHMLHGDMVELHEMLQEKRQAILYGPPGTGKTFVARALGRLLTGLADPPPERMQVVQFHPAYSYEDFIEGIQPKSRQLEDGRYVVDYPPQSGVFKQFCQRAQQLGNAPCVFIIDEINRGNIARIFGELMLLLEYRDQDVTLPYSGKRFRIPPNVYLIGTMNTADRSIAMVDFALRRRFHFFYFGADADLLARWWEGKPLPVPYLLTLYERLSQEAISDPDFAIGPSHFMDASLTEARLERIWRRSILPYLEEYYLDQRAKVDTWRWDSDRMRQIRGEA